MIEKRKIIQLTLISIGLVLILFTYFIYPTINKNKLFEAKTGKEKINLQEKIKKLLGIIHLHHCLFWGIK